MFGFKRQKKLVRTGTWAGARKQKSGLQHLLPPKKKKKPA